MPNIELNGKLHGSQANVRNGEGALLGAGCRCLVTKSFPTLCYPMDCSPPGSPVHGIFRQEQWCALPFPSLGDLPNSGIKPTSPAWHVVSLPLSHLGCPWGRRQKWQLWSWHRLKNKIFFFFKYSCVVSLQFLR